MMFNVLMFLIFINVIHSIVEVNGMPTKDHCQDTNKLYGNLFENAIPDLLQKI